MFWIMLACLGIFLLIHNTYIYYMFVYIFMHIQRGPWPGKSIAAVWPLCYAQTWHT